MRRGKKSKLEGMGSGKWKKVRAIYDEIAKKQSWREMEPLIEEAKEITKKLTGVDRVHAEVYTAMMERTLASWRIIELDQAKEKNK